MRTSKVAVIGSGTWGTAAAGLVAPKADEVTIWARTPEVADAITAKHHNPRHLSSYELPSNVDATSSMGEAMAGAEMALMVVPSAYLRDTCRALAPSVPADLPIVVLTKGIEPVTHKLMADVCADELGGPERFAVLSGPNHAEEICRNMVSAAVVAAEDESLAMRFQELFVGPAFRAYHSCDLRGVEVCGAVKNVIAIACGVAAGLGYGDNTLAVLMTRGLAEIGRVVSALGGDPMTCMGLAGMGDLIATCTSQHSRNRTFGEAFVAGESLDAYEKRTRMVVEGARATQSCWELSRELGIECPITSAVHAILYEDRAMDEAIGSLLGRDPHVEFYGISDGRAS